MLLLDNGDQLKYYILTGVEAAGLLVAGAEVAAVAVVGELLAEHEEAVELAL
jgi:hypothetical protein